MKRLNFNFRTSFQRLMATYAVIAGFYIAAKVTGYSVLHLNPFTFAVVLACVGLMSMWIYTGSK